jgi:hypothetical protein
LTRVGGARLFVVVCRGCSNEVIRTGRIGEPEEAAIASHVTRCWGVPLPTLAKLEILLRFVDVRSA